MTFNITISHVDGKTDYNILTNDPETALNFLRNHDHEGSNISMEVDIDDAEEIYNLLRHKTVND